MTAWLTHHLARATSCGIPTRSPLIRRRGVARSMSTVTSLSDSSPGGGQIDRFGDQTLNVVCRTLGAEWGSFYRIGNGQRPFGFRSLGIPREFGVAYAQQGM